ncbi:hypothetical protein V8E36_004865 [Tilletia maclaganii]
MPTIEDFDDDFEFDLPAPPTGGASASSSHTAVPNDGATLLSHSGSKAPTAEETKDWICLYPIYFDAKRKYRGGCRRVKYESAALYPQSIHLAHACQLLGVKFNHELYKSHPQDWENPGRIRVQLFNEAGDPLQAHIPTKQELLKQMARLIQPIAGGKPPPLELLAKSTSKDAAPAAAESAEGSDKTQTQAQQPKTKKKRKSTQTPNPSPLRKRERLIRKTAHKRGFRLTQNPEDDSRFSIQSMLPPHSPAIEFGALNFDMGKAMGAAGGAMGGLGSMLGGLGLGGDDDEEEGGGEAGGETAKVDKPLTPLEKQQQMIAQMGRRQRKVVRIGR